MSSFDFKVWIDADACPNIVKEVIFKACAKNQVMTTLVANSHINIPRSDYITFIQVDQGADVADTYIVENSKETDIVITADIPLAALIVEKGAIAINPRGELYTEENIGERLSMRDFMKDLRDGGLVTGGPPPLGTKDKAMFANSFNKIFNKQLAKRQV